ncbi:MAG: hypothetical protein KC646_10210 [Candidatus Cloacimonetes bacterium]|nr:hypothetical protein [Candidatus Cloacimonadota bacterium]
MDKLEKKVYLLQHCYELNDQEEVKVIGIYSSKEEANNTIERLVLEVGFKDYPDKFFVDEYLLNKDHWCDGFVTVR